MSDNRAECTQTYADNHPKKVLMNSVKKITTNICILGGGPAGYVAAIRASQLGAEVVLIEEKELGGVCLHAGCIPTKALLKTAETAAAIKRSKEFGIESRIEGINWNSAEGRKDKVVKNLAAGVVQLLDAKGITVINAGAPPLPTKKYWFRHRKKQSK